MPQKRRKSAYAWLWVLALAALSAAISITHYKIGDSDYYWHCMYGQILATTHKMPATDPVSWLAAESGLHYIDYSWFCDLLLYKLSLLGPIETYCGLLFFLLFSTLVTILIFSLWGQGVIQRLRQNWQTALLSLAILVGCLVLQLPADPCSRPKLVSLLLFVLSVYWVQKPGFKSFPTIFIAILWANLHGTALPTLFVLQAGALFLDVLPTFNANCLQFTSSCADITPKHPGGRHQSLGISPVLSTRRNPTSQQNYSYHRAFPIHTKSVCIHFCSTAK